ncbi:MAG TPA: hypothetical protein VM915_16690 [Verrucomicrobiae bacterium]|nr:hypothetical protein [Verrucomicrobiae bacterium]
MREDNTPVLEWIMGGAGALIFAVLVGFTAWCAVMGGDGPPIVAAQVQEVIDTAHGHIVKIEVQNTGDTTAADATLIAALRVGGEIVETHTLTFDYLPRHSSRRGGFVFARDPRDGQLIVVGDGYVDP